MDTLYIEQLVAMARIGVNDWEKQCLQKLIFDIKLVYNKKLCIYSNLNLKYLDYSKINEIILNVINTRHFFLIEELAETLSMILIDNFSMIFEVFIKVSKPTALHNARNVGIYIKRNKLNSNKKIKFYLG